ncbi:CCC motif membrane protein [Lacinutrix sp.]|uniref:CCC motif membrane protein n=1 Tax=Lacinutrix sp. TaxID=1937692 RepID=UPI0025B8A87F|nr:CCC motif membrane protein [Lacinutrix sp.]
MKKQLNPTLVYVLSIIGLLCCCFGGLGIFLSAPAYFVANGKIKDAQLNPNDYEGNTKKMETAKLIALIVSIICILNLIYTIYSISTVGWDEMTEQFRQAMEEAQSAQ